jgi:thiosulfate dehydrogenase [quinone] large subunit
MRGEEAMSTNVRMRDPRLIAAVWLIARCWVGWQFLHAGLAKLTGDERARWVGGQAGSEVRGFLGYALQLAPGGKLAGPHPEVLGWYAALIRHGLLPHAAIFGYLVAFGEVLVGAALILGLLTRFAAAMGLLMNFAYLCAGVSGVGPLMVLIELPLLLVGATAGDYGLDRWLRPALRGWLDQWSGAPARPVAAQPSLRTG